MLARWVSLMALALLSLTWLTPHARAATADSGTEAERSVPVAAPPAWIAVAPPEPRPPANRAEQGGLVNELVDDQFRVGDKVEHYARRMKRITSAAGVDEAGQLHVEFDPSYEQLRWHGLRLVRSGEIIDALKTSTIRVIQQERDLDQRIYNGTLTANIFIHDLRVGDVIDFDYSIEGQNPVFGGRFVAKLPLSSLYATDHLRVRVLFPPSRTLAFKASGGAVDPVVRPVDGAREFTWERRDVPAIVFERDTPRWHSQMATLGLSEFASWGDVAAWALPLFDEALPSTPDVVATAETIARSHASPAARAVAALRFVQDEVRYLGIEMGANSHRPHAATLVLKQRFGDCKDKSVLLVALLRALGVEAHAVLVHTSLRAHVADELPSPYAFNHAIVRLRIGGKEVWVDPTRAAERGPLGDVPIRYGRALVAAPGATDLAFIETRMPTEATSVTRETYRIHDDDASLDVVRIFRQGEASAIRYRLSAAPRAEIQKGYLSDYADYYPTIEPRHDLEVEDDTERNVVVLRETYMIRGAAKDGSFSYRANTVLDVVGRPQSTRRTAPLAVEFPVFLRHEIEIFHLEASPFIEPPDENFHDAALAFTVRGESDKDRSTLDYEVRTHRDYVAPGEIADHMTMLEGIGRVTHYSIGRPKKEAYEGGRGVFGFLSSLGGLFGLVGLFVFTSYAIGSFRGWSWKPRPKDNGQTARAAIAVSSRADAEKRLLEPRCSCGARFTGPVGDEAWAKVVFAEQDIATARIVCPSCNTPRVRYFKMG